MTEPGRLRVDVASESPFLRHSLPLVVRDARLAVVHRGTIGDRRITLPAGLYSIEVTAPDGALNTSVVQVHSGETSTVDVTTDTVAPQPDSNPWRDVFNSDIGLGPRDIDRLDRFQDVRSDGVVIGTRWRGVGPSVPKLLSANKCRGRRIGPDAWEFLPHKGATTTPTAVFESGRRRIEMSLALNPVADSPEDGACLVGSVRDRDGEYRLRMSYPTSRSLCATVDGLLLNNGAGGAPALVEGATEMLMAKYRDPVGAALGGLTLHGLGRLSERARWVENLARDFAWLPDGRVLHAALLMKHPDPRERRTGLRVLLSATMQRPLFTDGLSLAMELLRRWPHSGSTLERERRLDELADYSAYADWDSINLSVDVTDAPR